MEQVQAAIAQAVRLDTEARLHKTQAEYHRREAQRKRVALAEFIERCNAAGITVVIEPMRTHAQGGTSGNDQQEEAGQGAG